MPYIKQTDRRKFEKRHVDVYVGDYLEAEGFYSPSTAGELNYLVTKLIKEYIGESYNYQKINDVIGALEGAKLEFYRRVAAPYEDTKIKENGDVY